MSDNELPPGASGVFRLIFDGAKRVKRAMTGEYPPMLVPRAHALAERIAQAFVAGRFDELHAMGTPGFQRRVSRESFASRWHDSVAEHGPLHASAISNAGPIELGFVPGLEEVPQSQFLGFAEIRFATPKATIEDPGAFTLGAVLVDYEGIALLGALHKR